MAVPAFHKVFSKFIFYSQAFHKNAVTAPYNKNHRRTEAATEILYMIPPHTKNTPSERPVLSARGVSLCVRRYTQICHFGAIARKIHANKALCKRRCIARPAAKAKGCILRNTKRRIRMQRFVLQNATFIKEILPYACRMRFFLLLLIEQCKCFMRTPVSIRHKVL